MPASTFSAAACASSAAFEAASAARTPRREPLQPSARYSWAPWHSARPRVPRRGACARACWTSGFVFGSFATTFLRSLCSAIRGSLPASTRVRVGPDCWLSSRSPCPFRCGSEACIQAHSRGFGPPPRLSAGKSERCYRERKGDIAKRCRLGPDPKTRARQKPVRFVPAARARRGASQPVWLAFAILSLGTGV